MKTIPFIVLIPFASTFTGCVVGPDFKTPDAPAVTGYTPERMLPQTAHGAAQRFMPDMDIPGEWWQLFHS